MSKKQQRIIHIVFWLVFIAMNLLFEWISRKTDFLNLWRILQEIAFLLLQMIIFYLNYSWICKNTIPAKKWGWFVMGQVFLLFLFPTLRHLFEEVIIYQITGKHNYDKDLLLTPFYFFDNTYYAIRIILFSLIFYFIKYIWNANQQMNELLLQKKQAELQNLRNQLSPHFLFNTLNSFYADLIDSQPKIAEDMLKLSDMLRYITYENNSEKARLKDEIQFIQNYIDLFSRRFDGNLCVNFSTEIHNENVQIPSLFLIHFVENALKHGVITNAQKPVKIQLKSNKKQLSFRVENYFTQNKSYDESGIGYKNIQKRLEILYPKNHILEIQNTGELYKVNVQIPLK